MKHVYVCPWCHPGDLIKAIGTSGCVAFSSYFQVFPQRRARAGTPDPVPSKLIIYTWSSGFFRSTYPLLTSYTTKLQIFPKLCLALTIADPSLLAYLYIEWPPVSVLKKWKPAHRGEGTQKNQYVHDILLADPEKHFWNWLTTYGSIEFIKVQA